LTQHDKSDATTIYITRYNYEHVKGKLGANSVALTCDRTGTKYLSQEERKNARKETRERIKELLGSKERQK
jgi:hypothetical protein